jgi:hypothetical protein
MPSADPETNPQQFSYYQGNLEVIKKENAAV